MGNDTAQCALVWRALRFSARAVVRGLRNITDPASAAALVSWDVGRAAGLVAAALGMTYEEYRSR